MAARRSPGTGDTRTQILDVAERLVQERGFNGFSYADVADRLGITKPALHYHFAGKAELGDALIVRYASRFRDALVAIDAAVLDAPAKLAAYADLYVDVLRQNRMCLCGMLAAEYQTLPVPMTETVVRFFDDNEAWLGRVLETGRADGSLRYQGAPTAVARLIVGTLEGAMLVARPYGDIERLEAAVAHLLADLAAPDAPTA